MNILHKKHYKHYVLLFIKFTFLLSCELLLFYFLQLLGYKTYCVHYFMNYVYDFLIRYITVMKETNKIMNIIYVRAKIIILPQITFSIIYYITNIRNDDIIKL